MLHGYAAKEMEKLYSRLERGEVSKTPGLMEQWLSEKKLTEDEIVREAADTFSAGVDTVCCSSCKLFCILHFLQQCKLL